MSTCSSVQMKTRRKGSEHEHPRSPPSLVRWWFAGNVCTSCGSASYTLYVRLASIIAQLSQLITGSYQGLKRDPKNSMVSYPPALRMCLI